jgi:hypothetical protein
MTLKLFIWQFLYHAKNENGRKQNHLESETGQFGIYPNCFHPTKGLELDKKNSMVLVLVDDTRVKCVSGMTTCPALSSNPSTPKMHI